MKAGRLMTKSNNPGCLGIFLKIFGLLPKEISTTGKLPYALRDDFLSAAEFSFYKVLDQAVGREYIICPKVGLDDIFFVTVKDRSKHSTYLNKINRKHVDYLLCDPMTMKPVCGIELDDLSHQRKDRMDRDIFVDQLFKDAGLSLVHVNNKNTYTIPQIQEIIRARNQITNMNLITLTEEQSIYSSPEPICKKCGSPMVRRISKKGANVGKEFYGCSNFPKCREMMESEE
jgi:hypothetical protein